MFTVKKWKKINKKLQIGINENNKIESIYNTKPKYMNSFLNWKNRKKEIDNVLNLQC